MKQLGAVLFILALMPVLLAGCSDDSQEVTPTGMELTFTECFSFGVWVFVEGEYQGMASSEEFAFFPLAPGTYDIYMASNARIGDTYFCWTDQVTVTDGNTIRLTYSCDGAECQDN